MKEEELEELYLKRYQTFLKYKENSLKTKEYIDQSNGKYIYSNDQLSADFTFLDYINYGINCDQYNNIFIKEHHENMNKLRNKNKNKQKISLMIGGITVISLFNSNNLMPYIIPGVLFGCSKLKNNLHNKKNILCKNGPVYSKSCIAIYKITNISITILQWYTIYKMINHYSDINSIKMELELYQVLTLLACGYLNNKFNINEINYERELRQTNVALNLSDQELEKLYYLKEYIQEKEEKEKVYGR